MANVKKDSAVSTEEEITREENAKTKKDTKIEDLEIPPISLVSSNIVTSY